MKQRLLTTSLVVAALFAGGLAHADNLVINHGFERNLLNWASNPDPNITSAWSSADAANSTSSGSGMVAWNGGSFPAFTAGGLFQFVPVLGGATYSLSGKANLQNGTIGNAVLIIIWKRKDAMPLRTDGVTIALQKDTWLGGAQNFVAPTDAAGAEVILTISKITGNSVLFDNILLKGPRPAVASTGASFTAIPLSIRPGTQALLTWSFSGATSVSIDHGIGAQPARGSVLVSPSSDTTYTLTATSSSGGPVATVSPVTTAMASVHVLTNAIVRVIRIPKGMFEPPNSAGTTSSFKMVNEGGEPASITLAQNGDFFTQSPSSFTIAAGGQQIVTITGKAMARGAYRGASLPTGNGVRIGLKIPVSLHVTNVPAAVVSAKVVTTRVDVRGTAASAIGSVTFANTGSTLLEGVLVSDVPWITPDSGVVTIQPGSSTKVNFAIDRTQRPDADSPTGSVSGTLSLFFPNGTLSTSSKRFLDTPPPSGTSMVGVVVSDTPSNTSSSSSPPLIGEGEVALIMPGVGHVIGSGGKEFISDVSILNSDGFAVDDMKLYYSSSVASLSSAQPVSTNTSLALADVVTTYFGQDNQVGTLQIRSKDAEKLSVNANVFNKSDPKGTYGTAIPVLRSDRSTGPGETMILGGLRKDATTHTNLYLQEMSGTAAMADVTFMDTSGNTVLKVTGQAIPAFGMVSLSNVTPTGAVAAAVTDTAGGRVSGYATPVDDASGDTWAVADWNLQYGFSGDEPMIVPVAGAAPGANGTNFRTDLAVMNVGVVPATITLTYAPSGSAVTKSLTLAPNETKTLDDVVPSFFGVSGVSVGSVTAVPVAGSPFNVTSRTYTSGTGPGTFGTGVPTLPLSESLGLGDSRVFGGIDDSMAATVTSQRGGTFRTNFALVETSGKSATVQVSVYFADGTQLTSGEANGSKALAVGPNQYLQINGLVQAIIGESRETSFGDLHNVKVRFDVIGGEGAVIPFITSTDNGTGDTVLRTQ